MQNVLYQKPKWLDYVLIVAGTGLIAVSIQCVFDPIRLVTGGFTGLAIIVKEITGNLIPGGVPLWLTNLMLNIPVFFAAMRIKGRDYILRTLLGTFLLSAWLYVIPSVDLTEGDFILAALFGGLIGGAGMGFVLLAKAATGGTDRHYSIVQLIQVLDGAIVLLGCFVFGIRAALYAIVAIFVMNRISDALMEGFKFSKAAFIITDRYEEVSRMILTQLDRGVTGLLAKGMYSGNDKMVLYCVVSKKEIVRVKEIVGEADPKAFVIVSDAREVLGEGFLEYSDQNGRGNA